MQNLESCYLHVLNKEVEQVSYHVSENLSSKKQKSDKLNEMLGELSSINVLNDCFHIWHDGPFGTINGLRMGRLTTLPVDWEEVNAGKKKPLLLMLCLLYMFTQLGATLLFY